MNCAVLLFCANLMICGVSGFADFSYYIVEKGTDLYNPPGLPSIYYFKEGMEYTVWCERGPQWDIHWEVEPYGLKSSHINRALHTAMNLILHRDDQITIGCYSKNKDSSVLENRTTTFYWDTIVEPVSSTPPSPVISIDDKDDAKLKCYPKNNPGKCASLLRELTGDLDYKYEFNLKIYNIANHVIGVKDIGSSNNNTALETIPNMTTRWEPVVAIVAVVAVLLVVCFICYRLIRKQRQQQDELYSYAYADRIRSEGSNPPSAPAEKIPYYARIIGILRRKKPRVEDLVYADIQNDGADALQGPPPPQLPPRFVTS